MIRFALAPVAGIVLVLAFAGCGPSAEQKAQQEALSAEMQQLRAENKEIQKLRLENQEIQRLRRDNQELHRLRADYQRFQQLQRDYQRLAGEAQQLSNLVQQLQVAQRENATLRSQNQQLQGTVSQSEQAAILAACQNNLRMLEAATDQWALENRKTATASPRAEEVQPYFPNNTIPGCPGGGVYRLNTVGAQPTCTIAGHKLP